MTGFRMMLAIGLWVLMTPSLAAHAGNDAASVVRGGRLYDNWIAEIRVEPPGERHPAYPPGAGIGISDAATWRCKECHGWDYQGKDGAYGAGRHATGIVGIRGAANRTVDNVVSILTDRTHGYGERLATVDLRDLSRFVRSGQIDMNALIDQKTGKVKAGALAAHFDSICANCHGTDGKAIAAISPLGELARINPWEALHKILNGHPGEAMPALRALHPEFTLGILAYAQTLRGESEAAAIVRGGRLYDNWPKEADRPVPKTNHPAYPLDGHFARQPDVNWRCKECHGWDYRGRDGVYARGQHRTAIRGIRGKQGADPTAILAVLKDADHRYAAKLSEHDLNALATFIAKGQVDATRYIDDATGRALGNPAPRADLYATLCASCHGLEGHKIVTMRPLGWTAANSPWQTLHLILNGHPDERMPALRLMGENAVRDLLAYLQTLPTRR